jgi:hypothetical protein
MAKALEKNRCFGGGDVAVVRAENASSRLANTFNIIA